MAATAVKPWGSTCRRPRAVSILAGFAPRDPLHTAHVVAMIGAERVGEDRVVAGCSRTAGGKSGLQGQGAG